MKIDPQKFPLNSVEKITYIIYTFIDFGKQCTKYQEEKMRKLYLCGPMSRA